MQKEERGFLSTSKDGSMCEGKCAVGESNIQELQERSLRGTDWSFQGGEYGVGAG